MSKPDIKDRKLLPCILCKELFSLRQAERLEYFGQTMICAGCYQDGQDFPYEAWCFGKKTAKAKTGKQYGYEPGTLTCGRFCPDREICQHFVSGRLQGRV